ncbi:MAG: restriction endonuclease subunit S, partial [Deltaproteobacteria bacterium]|nr:restriction endonuclease subunit S [Deltaproteobacteria bacterium]
RTGNSTGENYLFDSTEEVVFASYLVRFRIKSSEAEPRFVWYTMRSPQWWAFIRGARSGSAQAGANAKVLGMFKLKLPPLPEQRAIAHILGTLDDKIELNRRVNETLEAMAQALFRSWFVDFDPVVVNALKAGNPIPDKFAERAAHYRVNPDALGLPEHILHLFPDRFVDSELGPIPEGWEVKKLGHVIDVHDSKRVPLNSRQRAERKGPYRYYGASGIMDYVNDYIFDGIYILVGEDGTVIDKGDRPVVQYVWGKFWVNNHAHVLSGKHGVSNEYLYLILRNTNIRPFVTGAVQPKISQTNLKRIPAILPDEEVRRLFSASIDSLFSKYRKKGEETILLEKLRDTLLPKLISGELRVPDVEKILMNSE